ncbi:MAG: penicillin-binding protein 1C [Chitinophagaceae bacterium]|nr:penicillin-binding protein 1C [Chitinophagaceae bacterium]
MFRIWKFIGVVYRQFPRHRFFLKRIVVVFAGGTGFLLLLMLLFPLPKLPDFSTVVTNQKGEILHAFLTQDQKWRLKTELHEISPLLQNVIVNKEDRYFFRHPGINSFSLFRALVTNLSYGRRMSGGSTITMQVAKMLSPAKRNVFNKVREIFRALQLEFRYSKRQILQLYLNLLPYGGNIEGVKAASLLYLNKNPDHLSLAELTALSLIPNKPSRMIPGRHNDFIIKERNRWLRRFAERRVFSPKEIEDALAEPFHAKRQSFAKHIPHLAYALKKTGKPFIQTTIDINVQLKIEKIVHDYVRSQKLKNIHNAAVLIIDNRTHSVITYIGSADFQDTADGGQVDGIKAIRQPGSTLKPLLYALCFDEGLLTPKRVLTDVQVNYEGFIPENYDGTFNGHVSTEYALAQSLNIPAVKALRMLGHEKMIQKLIECRFRQIEKDRKKLGLSMVLGGCGASLEELTALFSVFANNGYFIKPRLEITHEQFPKRRIISPASAFMITEILSRIDRPDFPINWSATERMPKIAWKTGTSYGRRDAWSIGYNKHYTVGVWVGNFSGMGVADLSGAQTATPLLFRIFNTIDYDSDEFWYAMPDDCDIRKVCTETGLVPSSHCSETTTDYFIPLISSTQTCNNRQEITVSEDESISYCKECTPAAGTRRKWYSIIEPEMQSWYETHHIAFEKIPPHNPECVKIFQGQAPVITSPAHHTEYLIERKQPEPLQLSCQTANDVSRVYWYVNNSFYKSAHPREKVFFVPPEGPVKISCTDDKGRNRNISIMVKFVNL